MNVDHIWIVDNGTDRVYQYDNAATLPNGSSKAADAFFALAAGNTQPAGHRRSAGPRNPPTTETPVLAEPVSAETAPRGNDTALENMYYEPLKKFRIHRQAE